MTKRLRHLLVFSVLLGQAALLGRSAALHSAVVDEPAHLAAGISNWELGRFDLFKVNPPLVRMIAALPAIGAGAKADWSSYYAGVGTRAEFTVMDDFVRVNGGRTIWLVTLARWGLISLVLLGGWVCYRWARDLYGDAAGFIALVLWCFCPNVLAYGQILTADAGAAALGVAAGYTFWKWLRDPAWDRALVAGIVLGLAELTKTTWVVLFGLWPMMWLVASGQSLVASGFNRKSKIENPKFVHLVVVLALGVLCINAGYDFEGSGTPLRNYAFVSRPLTGASEGQPVMFGNRLAKSWLGRVPVPLPRNYLEGIDLQWHDIEVGKPSYLRGRWQERGWWYWYLYALAVKVPLGTWGLLVLAVAARVANRGNRGQGTGNSFTWRDELVLLAPAAVVLVLVSSQTGFSRYIRYVLPILPFVFIWIASLGQYLGVRRFIAALVCRGATLCRLQRYAVTTKKSGSAASQSSDESPHSILRESGALQAQSTLTPALSQGEREKAAHSIIGVLTALLLAWSVGSSFWYAPHWMSYFNELAGGPMGGPAHLIDAQVDWGQDLLYLKKWLDAHPEAEPLQLVYFGPIDPRLAGIELTLPPKAARVPDDPAAIGELPGDLRPGWYAISVNFLHGYPHYAADGHGGRTHFTRGAYNYFRRFQPVATAGYSIYIYHLTAEDIATARRQ